MENKKTLETVTFLRFPLNPVTSHINKLPTNGVTTASKIIGRIFFAGDQLFRME